MRGKFKFSLILSFALIFFCAAAGISAETFALEVHPEHLEIGTFFSGYRVNLSGSILTGQEIILEVMGPNEKSKFNMKGRVGPFWMNREMVELEQAPFFYKLLLPEMREGENRLPSLSVGIASLKDHIKMKPNHLDFNQVFDLFVQLKRSEKLYEELKDAIRYSSQNEGKKSFKASFSFPSSTAPGNYRIVSTVINGSRIENTSERSFRVEEVGIIKEVRRLAKRHGLLYGILSVIIALFVGAVIGVVFKRAGAH